VALSLHHHRVLVDREVQLVGIHTGELDSYCDSRGCLIDIGWGAPASLGQPHARRLGFAELPELSRAEYY
jgi:hypothetical protein